MIYSEKNSEKPSHDDLILAGILDAYSDDIVDGMVSRFAFYFIELLRSLGIKVYPMDQSKLNAADNKLAYLMKSQRVMGDFFYLENNWYRLEMDSFLGLYETDNSPVLVVRKGSKYYYVDPYDHTKEQVNEKNSSLIKPYAFFVYPTTDSKNMSGLVFAGLRDNWKEILLYFLLVISPFIAVGWFLLLLSVLNKDSASLANTTEFGASLVILVLVVLSVSFINIAASRIIYRISARIRSNIFPAILEHFFRMRSGEERKISRELVTTFIDFVDSIEMVINNGLKGLQYLIYSIAVVALIRNISVGVEKPFVLLLAGYMALSVLVGFFVYRRTIQQRIYQEGLSATRKEIIDSMDVIKHNAAEDRFYHRFAVAYGKYLTNRIKMDYLSAQPVVIANIVSGLGMFCMFTLIYKSGDPIPASSITFVVAILSMLMSFLMGFINSMYNVIKNIPSLYFGNTVLAGQTEIVGEGAMNLKINGKIEFSHVDFSYDGSKHMTLRDISFVIQPGEYVAICGGSGSGKSTLIRLLLGFEIPDEGKILIDDIDISQIDLQTLRRQMGVVLQDEGIINGSVKLNIGMEENPDMGKVVAAAEMASIADEIEQWPMKYFTILSNESELISGGQTQRIVLARSLMNNPGILILDEATSAMDNITQNKVKRNLDKMGSTRIVVAHRLSTIADCDKIIVLDKGRICEMGTYDALMEQNGVFANMARRNLL